VVGLPVDPPPTVLCLNSGSSSIKYAVIAGGDELARDVIGGLTDRSRSAAVAQVIAAVDALGVTINAVGHRIVHGGPDLTDHVRIDADVLATLRGAIQFAPLHLPDELATIDAITERAPEVLQVACLDTAFHRTLPAVARRFALPARFADQGIRRYGFHGLSYEYIVEAVGAARLGRAVIAHLGSGASLAAVADGASLDTTMGMTPTGGVVMGTRTGDLDPGVLLHLLRTGAVDEAGLAHLVDHESGLLGLSGSTSEVRDLLVARSEGDRGAALALAVFAYSVRKAIGSLAAALGGIDTLVFTGGVGEHAPAVRAEIVASLGFLGLSVDPKANEASGAATDGVISAVGSDGLARRPVILVVPTDEEAMIARHTLRLLGGA
jgi:acetate kinase